MCKQKFNLLAIKTKAEKHQLDCFSIEVERKPHETLEIVAADP